jgi:pyruvate kinase
LMDLAGAIPRLGVAISPSGKQKISRGEKLLLTRDLPTTIGSNCFQAQCSFPDIIDRLAPGMQVWIDNGKIGGQIEAIDTVGALLRVNHAKISGSKLRPNRVLHIPDADLQLPALTAKDLHDLDFILDRADSIGYNCCGGVEDLVLLQTAIHQRWTRSAKLPPIVLKLGTPQALTQLSELIFQIASKQPLAIVLSESDLGVRMGDRDLAALQTKILALCTAADIPIVWSTQALDRLVKRGGLMPAQIINPTIGCRSGGGAILNRGPFIAAAITILDRILDRSQNLPLFGESD